MPQTRSIEIKVGLFVLVCLAAAGALIVKFGKLEKASNKTYALHVEFPNVAGLVREANVMYAGIPVGHVRDIQLAEGNQLKVRVTLAIYEEYTIRQDAKFVINQSGLLGDRYVDVIPQTVTASPLKPGDTVKGISSVDLTEAIRGVIDVLHQAAGTIARIDDAIRRTDAAIQRIDELVLNTQSLRHVSSALANVDQTTSNAVLVTESLRNVIDESRQSITNTLNQLSGAADTINSTAGRISSLVVSNQDEVAGIVSNLAVSAARVNAILDGLQKGQGTAGKLLVDPTLHDEVVKLIQNWRRFGLLYKETSPARPRDEPIRSGKTPVPARPAGDSGTNR